MTTRKRNRLEEPPTLATMANMERAFAQEVCTCPPHVRECLEDCPSLRSLGKRKPQVMGKAIEKPRDADRMNDTEKAYQTEVLAPLLRQGLIARFDFEPEKLRLADNTYYSPDFRVVAVGGLVAFHEVKGFWRDDARVKIKIAAELHPYKFVAVMVKKIAKKRGGGWSFSREEEF